MPRKTKPSANPERRSYTDEFKRDAVAMLLVGHSATSIVERLGISGTNLLYRWKKQQVESTGPVGEVLDSRVVELEAEQVDGFSFGTVTSAPHSFCQIKASSESLRTHPPFVYSMASQSRRSTAIAIFP
ncbi:transposase [Rhodopirellula europaea]|uniref:transposase n=1 Tax=Rhodopirellula europaea TaxID=1263866 RepID=UPI003D29A72C